MTNTLKIEDILLQIKEKLNQEHVKLWLPPFYTTENGTSDEEIQKLSEAYSGLLGITKESCTAALRELQQNALERLRERNLFQDTGIATIKIRIPNENGTRTIVSLQKKLSATVEDVQREVAEQMGVECNRIKLIWRGKVLELNSTLETYGVKNGSQIMAVLLQSLGELQEVEERYRNLETTKADASFLANRSNDDDYYLQVADQSGNTLKLPDGEKKALVVAMTLHEKGRAAMKKEEYPLALVLLLEADKEFSRCQSELLKAVDNYALLNLDISWCYLCLGSVTHIPEAQERLNKCEQSFQQSYGPNLERLMVIKGTTGKEAALFMRLHLLQAIVLFYQNRRDEAAALLRRAEQELAALKVDDHTLSALVELGYSAAEARLGLRAAHGDLNSAVAYIIQRREERAEARRKDAAEKLLNRERRKLGRCADGVQWVEPDFVKMLERMGYSRETACAALRQSNNNVSLSVQLIQEHPELLAIASTSLTKITDELIQQVVAVGFDPRMARIALKKHKGNTVNALEELIASGGIIEGMEDSDSSDENDEVKRKKKEQDHEREIEAYKRLAEDLPTEEEDHLNVSLEAEERFLKEYLALLFPSQ